MVRPPHLILTVDYEIFGNGSGCVEHCIVNPASRLLEIAGSHGALITFFVEVLELQAMERGSFFRVEISKVRNQLKTAFLHGHDLQLHIHPQWQNAEWLEKKGWNLALDDWRIGDMSFNECLRLLKKGKLWLEELVYEGCTPYQCIAFRAGGWCIQPSEVIIQALMELGFMIDTTVASKLKNVTKGEWYDFRKAPDLPFWRVGSDVCIEAKSGIWEVPLATGVISRGRHMQAIRSAREVGMATGCSGSYKGPNGLMQSLRGKLHKLFHVGHVMLDFSTMPADILIDITEQWLDKYKDCQHPIPIVGIAHTKNFTASSERALEQYLTWARNNNILFSTYSQWLNAIEGFGV